MEAGRAKIVGIRKLLFLGAGASKPLGKMLMKEFVESLKEENPPGDDLFRALIQENADLEFLLEELESLLSKRYLRDFSPPTMYPPALTVTPGPIPNPPPKWKDMSDIMSQAASLTSWLKQQIFQHYRALLLSKVHENRLSRLLSCVMGDENDIAIFTTNYDPAIEEFARLGSGSWRLVDGFIHDERGAEYYWSRNAFDDFLPDPNRKTIILFKLHGSTTWIRQGPRIVKAPPVYAGTDTEYPNVMIYPATRKIALDDPFFSAYDYLGKCLSGAEFCLVVGYSFRDYDTLTKFRAAKLTNPRLKIAILDPYAKQLVKELEKFGIQAEPIPQVIDLLEDQYITHIKTLLA